MNSQKSAVSACAPTSGSGCRRYGGGPIRHDPSGEPSASKGTRREVDNSMRQFIGRKQADVLGTARTEVVVQIASILGRAHLQCVVSGIRFGLRTTKGLLRGHSRLFDHMRSSESPDGFREQALRIVVDETRGCLREVADASSHEFRRLQSELAKLQEEMRTLLSGANGSENKYTRRWKAKL
jgi:hypothetical protein